MHQYRSQLQAIIYLFIRLNMIHPIATSVLSCYAIKISLNPLARSFNHFFMQIFFCMFVDALTSEYKES